MFGKNKKLAFVGIFGLGTALLLSLFALLGTFELYQLKLSDTLQGDTAISPEITIVQIDEQTLAHLGEPQTWNRTNYEIVYSAISEFQPKVVGIDIFFQAERDELGDNLFRDALEDGPPTVIIYPMKDSSYDQENDYFVQAVDDVRNGLPIAKFRNLPHVKVSTSYALDDIDQVKRRLVPLIYDASQGSYFENFAFAVVREALGHPDRPTEPDISSDMYHMANGGLSIPLVDGQMIINYASRPFHSALPADISYKRVSFVDVYNGQIDNAEALFRDKIVLIGPTALFFNDSYPVPTSSEYEMDGVEIQANAIQTILEERFLVPMSLGQTFVLVLSISLVSATVFMFLPILWSLMYLIGFSLLYALTAPFFFDKGVILDLIHPYLALILTFVSVFLYRYFTEFKEKIALKSAFSKYVNPTIAQQIVDNPDQVKLGGEAREVTVIFTDIRGFTSISEKLQPKSLIALLNDYLSAMTNVIMAEGGTVDKYEGDAIMAFFGAPLDQKDHAIRACTSALKMGQALAELHQMWQSAEPLPGGESRPAIDFRCGIHTGSAIVGNVGSKNKLEYTAIGDAINLGSRLEGANRKYDTRIMVSEATYNAAKDHFEMRELDIIRVVGKEKPIRTFELLHFKGKLNKDEAMLLEQYHEGILLYKGQRFADALAKFEDILRRFPDDGPSKLYYQRCQVLKDYPPGEDWDGVFEMSSK